MHGGGYKKYSIGGLDWPCIYLHHLSNFLNTLSILCISPKTSKILSLRSSIESCLFSKKNSPNFASGQKCRPNSNTFWLHCIFQCMSACVLCLRYDNFACYIRTWRVFFSSKISTQFSKNFATWLWFLK